MANLGELNILMKLKGLPAVKSGLKDTRNEVDKVGKSAKESAKVFQDSFKKQELAAKQFQQQVRSMNRDINTFTRGMAQVSQSARALALTLSVPLVLGVREAAKSNLELSDSLKEIQLASNDVLRSVGDAMTPIIQDVANVVKKARDQWLSLNPEVREGVVRFAAFTAASLLLVSALGSVVVRLAKIAQFLKIPELVTLLGGGGVVGATAGLAGVIGGIQAAESRGMVPKGTTKQSVGLGSNLNIFQQMNNNLSNIAVKLGAGTAQNLAKNAKPTDLLNPAGAVISASAKATQDLATAGNAVDLGTITATKLGGGGKGENPFQPLISGFKDAFDKITEMNRNMATTIRDTISNVIITSIDGTSQAIGSAFAQSIVYGKDFEEAIKESMKAVAAQMLTTLISAIAKITILRALGVVGPISANALGLGGGSSSGGSSGGGGVGGFLKSLVGFADGGVVTKPTMGVFGEAGPEAVIPLDEMGNMGGSTIVNISGPIFLDDEAAQDKFVRKLKDALLRVSNRRTGGTSLAF